MSCCYSVFILSRPRPHVTFGEEKRSHPRHSTHLPVFLKNCFHSIHPSNPHAPFQAPQSAAHDPAARLHEGVEEVRPQGAHADDQVGEACKLLPVVSGERLPALSSGCGVGVKGWVARHAECSRVLYIIKLDPITSPNTR